MTKKKVLWIGIGADAALEEAEKSVRLPFETIELESVSNEFIKRRPVINNKQERCVLIAGAAGPEVIPERKLKAISDIYSPGTRQSYNDNASSNWLIAAAIDRRSSSIFEYGFDLELVLTNTYGPEGDPLDDASIKAKLAEVKKQYGPIVNRLRAWKEEKEIETLVQDMSGASYTHGRGVALISPGIMELQPGQLPYMVEILNEDDIAEPIIDVGLTRKLVGLRTNFEDKKVCRADELIYMVRGKKYLRKEGKFWGTSLLESIMIISKAIKRIYNYNIDESIIAAYVTKVIFGVNPEGGDENLQNDIKTFLEDYMKNGKYAYAYNSMAINDVKQVAVKVDWPMLDGAERKLSNAALTILGVPRSMMNMEHNLNRDIATIEAIQFKKFIVKPDERMNSSVLENQLFNMLFAHLVGSPLVEIPARINIIAKKPDPGSLDTLYEDKLAQQKESEINSQQIQQPGATSPFGAAGPEGFRVTSLGDGSYIVKPNNPLSKSS